MLQLKNVQKNYKQGNATIQVLKGINVEFKANEIVAIVGQSGSGKSTLLSLLAGLDKSDLGEIVIDGQDLGKLSESALTDFRAQKIGIVFQQFHLLGHLTALENVMIPLEILKISNPKEAAKKILEQLGLGHRIDHLPSELSGGECQRVAIARALVAKPKLVLADEPSGSLDVKTGVDVMENFFQMARQNNALTILVTHNEELAKKCDRVLHLKNGNFQ